MKLPSIAVAAALWSGAAAATAAQTAPVTLCVSPREAEAIVTLVAPDLVRLTATMCAPSLPATAYLRRPADQLAARYAMNGDGAWPVARAALRKLLPPDAAQMVENDFARPLVGSLLAPLIVKDLKPQDCGSIDRLLTLIDPLPARNTVGLVVTVAELAQRKQQTKGGFVICEPGGGKP
ncbi:hypothetical protein [Sphingomonas sp.]|uniref:hypothetical protein n=1 Tax=Sphingomonas sp. TaxID=28214 RepID=UPI002CA5C1C4|nr:hypothetical protein [Sphingomonas sp.]HWK36770.1 hypothetical protein [Sphingomonas sp.]